MCLTVIVIACAAYRGRWTNSQQTFQPVFILAAIFDLVLRQKMIISFILHSFSVVLLDENSKRFSPVLVDEKSLGYILVHF